MGNTVRSLACSLAAHAEGWLRIHDLHVAWVLTTLIKNKKLRQFSIAEG